MAFLSVLRRVCCLESLEMLDAGSESNLLCSNPANGGANIVFVCLDEGLLRQDAPP